MCPTRARSRLPKPWLDLILNGCCKDKTTERRRKGWLLLAACRLEALLGAERVLWVDGIAGADRPNLKAERCSSSLRSVSEPTAGDPSTSSIRLCSIRQ